MKWWNSIGVLIALGCLQGATGCATAVPLRVLEPAEVMVPPHVQTLAVIDRSRAADAGQTALGVLEAAVTGEEIGTDLEGRSEATRGVVETLRGSPRFQIVQPMVDRRQADSDLFGHEMNWAAAHRICRQTGCQGILALEIFDSDSRLVDMPRTEETTDDKGHKKVRRYHEAERETRVMVGWRIYDLERRTVVDQLLDQVRADTHREQGATFQEALSRLPPQRETVRQLGFQLGVDYGRRVAPTYITVHRKLYDRGDPRLKEGRERVLANDWKSATAIWERMSSDPDPKLAGKATYNLALAKEVEGDLDGALELARKAEGSLQNSRTRNYVQVLRQRIADRARLDQQLAPPTEPPPPPPPRRR